MLEPQITPTTMAEQHTEDDATNFINAIVLDKVSGKPLKYSNLKNTDDKDEWEEAEHTEWIRLTKKTETARFMKKHEARGDCKPSYYNPQPEMKMKDAKLIHRIRGTYGVHKGDIYPDDLAAYIADLTTTKLILNKVVSTPGARFMTLDITDFYLGTPLKYKRYLKVHKKMIPSKTRTELQIADNDFDINGYIYVEITKGMYGLPEAGILAQQRLYKHLIEHQFELAENTSGLLKHKTRNLTFSLVVDDFGVCYTDQADVQYLIETLQKLYQITIDWTGTKYLKMTIDHNIIDQTITLSMPGYIEKALHRFGINDKTKTVNTPGPHTKPTYGKQTQENYIDQSPKLSAEHQKFIEQVVGVMLYYARAIDR